MTLPRLFYAGALDFREQAGRDIRWRFLRRAVDGEPQNCRPHRLNPILRHLFHHCAAVLSNVQPNRKFLCCFRANGEHSGSIVDLSACRAPGRIPGYP